MKYPKLVIGLMAICLALMGVAHMGCSSNTPGTIETSTSQAIETAKAKISSDGIMTLVDRNEVVVDEGANWHVYFPFKDAELLGGEPHVLISKSDGSVVGTYYTQ